MAILRKQTGLPVQLPIFPLPGAMLLPFGRLPLQIFEPRYLNMIDDALGGERTIGMVQPREAVTDPVPDNARLYDIGTAGRIVEFHELESNRYIITLEGIVRFRIEHELTADHRRGYRMIRPDFGPFENDQDLSEADDAPSRERILTLMRAYFDHNAIEANWESLAEAPYDALITSLAMMCPFTPREKQALLECADTPERAIMLISLLEMNIESGDDGGFTH